MSRRRRTQNQNQTADANANKLPELPADAYTEIILHLDHNTFLAMHLVSKDMFKLIQASQLWEKRTDESRSEFIREKISNKISTLRGELRGLSPRRSAAGQQQNSPRISGAPASFPFFFTIINSPSKSSNKSPRLKGQKKKKSDAIRAEIRELEHCREEPRFSP